MILSFIGGEQGLFSLYVQTINHQPDPHAFKASYEVYVYVYKKQTTT